MLRSLLNSETMNTNGAINPCHSPSQNPATETFSPGTPFILSGPGTQPADIATNSTTRMSAANFMTNLLHPAPPKRGNCLPAGLDPTLLPRPRVSRNTGSTRSRGLWHGRNEHRLATTHSRTYGRNESPHLSPCRIGDTAPAAACAAGNRQGSRAPWE